MLALRHMPLALRHMPLALRHMPLALRHMPLALRHMPLALRHMPLALRHMMHTYGIGSPVYNLTCSQGTFDTMFELVSPRVWAPHDLVTMSVTAAVTVSAQ
jgi:hypothetical protein